MNKFEPSRRQSLENTFFVKFLNTYLSGMFLTEMVF